MCSHARRVLCQSLKVGFNTMTTPPSTNSTAPSSTQLGHAFTVIYLDLTAVVGNDLVLQGVSFVRQLASAFEGSCRAIVVKVRRRER